MNFRNVNISRKCTESPCALQASDESVYDNEGRVKSQPHADMSYDRLCRFIRRYRHFYKQPQSDSRTFILRELEEVAKIRNIRLPKLEVAE